MVERLRGQLARLARLFTPAAAPGSRLIAAGRGLHQASRSRAAPPMDQRGCRRTARLRSRPGRMLATSSAENPSAASASGGSHAGRCRRRVSVRAASRCARSRSVRAEARLPRPVSMARRCKSGRLGTDIGHHVRAVRASVRAATGAAITRDRSSTRTPDSGRWTRGPGFWRGLADLLDGQHRKRGERIVLRRRRPFVVGAHQRDHRAAVIGRGLEGFAVPLIQRGLDFSRSCSATRARCRRRRDDA